MLPRFETGAGKGRECEWMRGKAGKRQEIFVDRHRKVRKIDTSFEETRPSDYRLLAIDTTAGDSGKG